MDKTETDKAIQEMDKLLKEETAKRKKQLMRREVPAERTLANALLGMTRQELDDIRYNIGLSGTSTLKKAELIEKLVPAIVKFAGSWFVSLLDEQYQAFEHLVKRDGISTEFRADEMRLDYFQSIGILSSGASGGKLAWYMPEEVMTEFKKLDSGTFKKAVEFNTDVLRLASGVLFYYGVLDYDQLFAKVKKYLEQDDDTFKFVDFMGVMLNGSCWQHNIVTAERVAYYYTVIDANKILAAQQRLGLGFADIAYDKVYDAGEENYIEASDSYKSLAQFLMQKYEFNVLRAAEIVGEITILLQNCGQMKDVVKYLDSLDVLQKEDNSTDLVALLTAFHNTLRLWTLKGHTPGELMSGRLNGADKGRGKVIPFAPRRAGRVGRNDPCPCGSGKKYKKCCMSKDLEKE